MGHLADLLVNAGHNVTVFIPEMDNIEETGTKLAQKIIKMKGLFNVVEQITNFDAFNEEISSYSARRSEDEGMKKEELEILKNSNFDLAFSNMIDYCLQGIIKYLGIEKQIWISTGPLPEGPLWFLGIPLPLSISPLLQQTTMLGPRMNMMERATNIWQFALSWYSVIQTLRKENELFRSYISPNFPSLDKVLSEVDLAFVYNDEFLDPALPTLPKVISIGGLGIKPANYSINKLGIKLVKAIESSKKGTIIFSMGSITDTKFFNKEKWQNILKAFSYFEEYSFIVKISAGDIFTQEYTKNMPNIHLFEWFPQSDLLGM
uniref:glucuronosyltransferase n=1 Tax=Meloidogyne javanica TaxID=6303 RepID=A0A915MMK7_MELJA